MAASISRQRVDGVLLLDKPTGITSNGALQRAKRLLAAAKAGHIGTLDPLATGLLPVCFGEATKFSSGAFGADKTYEAEILLGVTTDTGDTDGTVTARSSVAVGRELVAAALQQYTGIIAQTPPMYSALKRGGRPLYDYARAGIEIALEPRNVTIYGIALHDFQSDRVRITVRCGKGTYIRVLATDLGRALGCGATLAGLRRVAVGTFDISAALGLSRLEELTQGERLGCLLPVDVMVGSLPKLILAPAHARRILNGQAVECEEGVAGSVRLYDEGERFLGLGALDAVGAGWRLTASRLVSTQAQTGVAAQ